MSDQTYDEGRARNLEALLRALAARINEVDARGELLKHAGELTRLIGDVRSELFHYEVRATYDAARTTDEFKNHWANADALDADSANSKAVRATLVQRSRYEVGNNGYADGMVQPKAPSIATGVHAGNCDNQLRIASRSACSKRARRSVRKVPSPFCSITLTWLNRR